MNWGDLSAKMTIFGSGAAGALALHKLWTRLGPPRERPARHFYANGRTEKLIDMIDDLWAARRRDHQRLASLESELSSLRSQLLDK